MELDPYEHELPPLYNLAVIQPGVMVLNVDVPYRELDEDQRHRDDIDRDQRSQDFED